eukprot:scaffold185481_cov114-Cyclotella_meneghiniana.AAC.1
MPKVEQDKAIINQLLHSKANINEIGTEIQHKRLYKIPFIPSKGESDDARLLQTTSIIACALAMLHGIKRHR